MPITWYGERGVVNAIVTFLIKDDHEDVTRVKEFLRCVEWANGEPAGWIDGIETVEAIVEIGLADFGSPDLTLIVNRDRDDSHIVFLEAKVVPYEASALPNDRGMQNEARRYNSAINGQLALKYRFVQALATRIDGAAPIIEPEELWDAYRRTPQDGGLADPKARPRKLFKPGVREVFAGDWAADRCHYVALTCDEAPFFLAPADRMRPLLPLLLAQNSHGEWSPSLANVGWLGYRVLTAEPATVGGPHLMAALNTMVEFPAQAPPPPPADHDGGVDGAVAGDLIEQVRQCASARFGRGAVKANSRERTTSVTVCKKRRAKIGYVAGGTRIHFGVAAMESPESWVEQACGQRLPWRGDFVEVYLPQAAAAALAAVESVFEKLEERYGD